jgi:hypothetical protein
MRKSREILRLKWVLGRSHREVERACSVGLGTVSETVGRARVAGLDWAAVERLTDAELEARLYPKLAQGTSRARPDPVYLHTELHRPGVTLRVISQMTFGSVNAASTVGFSLTLGPGPPVPPCDPSAPLPHSPNLL